MLLLGPGMTAGLIGIATMPPCRPSACAQSSRSNEKATHPYRMSLRLLFQSGQQ